MSGRPGPASGGRFALLASTIALLATLTPAPALAAEEETHLFDATLSLTGDCSTATVDTVPDPGTCPGTPGVDHPSVAFKVPKGTAVDAYGNRYVASFGPEFANPNEGRIDIFDSSGHFITEIPDPHGPRSLAVDSAGNLYVHERIPTEEFGKIVRYPPNEYEPKTGQIKYSLPPVVVFSDLNSNGQIALDRSTGRLFYQRSNAVFEFGSATEGNPLLDETIGLGHLIFSADIAIDAAHQRIYSETVEEGGTHPLIRVFNLKAPHELLGTIDGSTTPAKAFTSSTLGLAVEESTGHLFVGDTAVAKKVYELELNGSYVSTIKPSAGSFALIGYPQMVVDNSPKSPNRGYLYVPSGEGTPGRSLAFKPLHPVTANEFALTLKKQGGEGTVVSSPAGISCATSCSEQSAKFAEGELVTLTATPAEGFSFAGWSGSGCSGTGTCKVTMTEAKSVTAEFKASAKPKFALKVKTTGAGSGKVTSTPAGIDCGATCEAEYEEGTKVTLAQSASAGSKFTEWSGACTGTGTCEVTMSSAKEVTAKFDLVPKFKLSVSKTGTGQGTVTSTPAGISCGATCSAEYEAGKEVELKEAPEAGSEFVKWSGACSGTGACKVTMSEAKSVTAEFKLAAKPKFLLKVGKTGTGTGKVTGPSIDCGSECEAEYEEGTTVALTQSASAGSKFTEWQGACTGSGTCEVTMSAAKEVTAKFDLVPKFKLSVSKTGTGTVTSTPAGISCGSTCEAEFDTGTEVELKESPEAGSEFKEWSGACSGTGTCKVTMSAAREVTATFEAEEVGPLNPTLLKVVRAGEGTVTSSPGGIVCGSECEANFEKETTVTLTASPATGYAFSAWAGCTEHVGLTCKVLMDKAKTVKVTFVATPSLTLEKPIGNTGTGKVGATGISCDENCSKAISSIKAGTSVTIKTTPAKGSEAAVISGSGSASACSGSTCTFTISENSRVEVKFEAIQTHKLTVSLTGPAAYKGKVSGKGIVKGLTASAINCGAGCTSQTESFFAGDTVTLSAVAGTGYTFAGWGTGVGTCTGKTTPCTVPMSADHSLAAKFE
jgi:hypothetical protein